MRVTGDESVQQLLRLHIAYAPQVCSRHTADLDAGMPARGLNGEAYRGHVFWDEIYAFPFFNVRLPEVTHGLPTYRYRRMGEARAAAHEAGFRGAISGGRAGARESRRPSCSTSTPSRASGSPTSAEPAGRQRGDLLQPLALLPDHP